MWKGLVEEKNSRQANVAGAQTVKGSMGPSVAEEVGSTPHRILKSCKSLIMRDR